MGNDPKWNRLYDEKQSKREKRQIRIWKATRHWPKPKLVAANSLTIWGWMFLVAAVIVTWFLCVITSASF